jgi:hypothetical protein
VFGWGETLSEEIRKRVPVLAAGPIRETMHVYSGPSCWGATAPALTDHQHSRKANRKRQAYQDGGLRGHTPGFV